MNIKNIIRFDNMRDNDGRIVGKKLLLFGRVFYFPDKLLRPHALDEKIIQIQNPPLRKFNDYISIAAIAKNEGPYIKEWIEYHKLIGADRFYFYDNESTDNTKEVLKPYIEDGTVIYHYVKGKCLQMPVYRDAVFRYKNNTRWMVIIDLDEYIAPVEKDNLKDFMKDYEKYSGLVINWIMFDSNGYIEHPEGRLITEAYTRCNKHHKTDTHVKTVLNPKKVWYIDNPHFVHYKNSKFPVDENFKPNYEKWRTETFSGNKIQLNHYYSKSLEEYKTKISKGRACVETKKSFISEYVNFKETSYNYAIQRFVPELRRRIGM